MNNMKLEAIMAILMMAAGTLIMGWSIFAEGRSGAIGYVGLVIFGIGMLLACGIFLNYFNEKRKLKT